MRAAIALASIAVALSSAGAQTAQKLPRTEVVVISDLSNRIDLKLHPGQFQRDTAIVHLIANEFASLVKRNRYLFSRDRLRMLYVGGENSPSEPRVDVAKMNEDHRVVVKELPEELRSFAAQAIRPYLTPRTSYQGADLWSWFHYTAPKILPVADPNREVRTKIVILTDGYLEFSPNIKREPGTAMNMVALRGKPNWEKLYPRYKLKSAGSTMVNTEVLILEVAPVRPAVNTAEEAIIERYWSDWFENMGAKTTFLTTSDALPTVGDAIHQFLAR
jgi:hypothetical protein